MNRLARKLLIAGLILAIGCPVIGIAVTVFFMIQSFHTLNQSGVTDASRLAGQIGNSLIAAAAGFICAVPGVVMIVASLVQHERAAKSPNAQNVAAVYDRR